MRWRWRRSGGEGWGAKVVRQPLGRTSSDWLGGRRSFFGNLQMVRHRGRAGSDECITVRGCLRVLHRLRDAVDDVRDTEAAANALDALDGLLPKVTLQDAGDEIDHHDVVLVAEDACQLREYLHGLRVDDQLGHLGNRRALRLHALSELSGEAKNGVIPDVVGDLFVTFSLVPNVDETVVHTHLEFCRCLVAATLVLVELFQTLQG